MSDVDNAQVFLFESQKLYHEVTRLSLTKEIAGENCVIVTPEAIRQLGVALCRWASAYGTMINEEIVRQKGLSNG